MMTMKRQYCFSFEEGDMDCVAWRYGVLDEASAICLTTFPTIVATLSSLLLLTRSSPFKIEVVSSTRVIGLNRDHS